MKLKRVAGGGPEEQGNELVWMMRNSRMLSHTVRQPEAKDKGEHSGAMSHSGEVWTHMRQKKKNQKQTDKQGPTSVKLGCER